MDSATSGRYAALVTGGASGIGREITLAYAAKGWDVICQYHTSPEAGEVERQARALGVSCELVQADLGDRAQAEALAKSLAGRRVDALVNNAGSAVVSRPMAELTFDDMEQAFRLNVFAPTLLAMAVFPGMCERGFGRIVNISSVAAKYGGSSNTMHYGQTKRALEGLTLTLGREGACRGVLVNTVRPGVVDTAFHTRFPKDMTARVAMIPARRMATASEVARVAVFLGSQDNGFVTRECLAVAGGE